MKEDARQLIYNKGMRIKQSNKIENVNGYICFEDNNFQCRKECHKFL